MPFLLQKRDNDMNSWNVQNAKSYIGMKMAINKNKNESTSTVLNLEKNEIIIFVVLFMLKTI